MCPGPCIIPELYVIGGSSCSRRRGSYSSRRKFRSRYCVFGVSGTQVLGQR